MRGVEPYDSAAPAKAGNRQAADIAFSGFIGVRNRGVQVTHDLGVGHFTDDLGDDVLKVRDIRNIALPGEQFWRNREVAQLGKPPADVLNVFVNAEDLFHHQHNWERAAAVRRRLVTGDLEVAGRNPDLTCEE